MKKNEKQMMEAPTKEAKKSIQDLARELHTELFPEEHDYMYDSSSEAKERLKGISPMKAEYIERRNLFRAQIGISPFQDGPDIENENTLSWVQRKLQQGEEAQIREIIARRKREASETDKQRERVRQQLQTPDWLDQKIDMMLRGEKFLPLQNPDKTNPETISFRIMGELFSINPQEESDTEFFRQIKRILPGLPEDKYIALHQQALEKWVESYGY